eukprot:213513-Prymnesium_polylepis.2
MRSRSIRAQGRGLVHGRAGTAWASHGVLCSLENVRPNRGCGVRLQMSGEGVEISGVEDGVVLGANEGARGST